MVKLPEISMLATPLPSVELAGVNFSAKKKGIPPEILSALVCWYSPKRQKSTNESLMENPVLRDLSGNGNDLTMYNFAFTEDSGINADGALAFDGVDDFCNTMNCRFYKIGDFSVVCKRNIITTGVIASNVNTDSTGFIIYERAGNVNYMQCYRTENRVAGAPFKGELITYATPTRFRIYDTNIDVPLTRGTGCLPSTSFSLGAISTRHKEHPKLKGTISSFLMFDRSLSDEEFEFVIKNMVN